MGTLFRRRLTLMWGLVILFKGGLTLWLLESLGTVNLVLIKGGAIITVTLTAAVVTIVWSVIVGRQEGHPPFEVTPHSPGTTSRPSTDRTARHAVARSRPTSPGGVRRPIPEA